MQPSVTVKSLIYSLTAREGEESGAFQRVEFSLYQSCEADNSLGEGGVFFPKKEDGASFALIERRKIYILIV